MDEAAKLVSELQHKLAELDQKVWQYRRDMASEFDKYAESLLRGVPKEVSETVSQSIAASMRECKSLYPDGARSIESSGSIQANGAGQSQPSILPIKAASQRRDKDEADESPQSPQHEREKEFQGLFTPSYLPLLDSTSRNERRSSPDPPPSPRQGLKGKQTEMDPLTVNASTDTRSLTTSPELRRPATPKRRNTDEVSVASDWSDGPTRRSALRRSSSSSKGHSPRRVRFDVAGEEVSGTAHFRPRGALKAFTTDQETGASCPQGESDANSTQVLPTASPLPFKSILVEDIPPSSFVPDSDEEAGSEQIENVDESPPKRISSSQALRALSRSPLVDDGTQWTTVTAPPDGSASVATSNDFQGSPDDELEMRNNTSEANILQPLNVAAASVNSVEAPIEMKDGEQAETPSDDELLDMPPLRRQSASPASMLSPIDPPDITGNKSPTASTRSPGKPLHSLETIGGIPQTAGTLSLDEEYNHDDLFDFDDDNEEKSPPALQQEEDESEESPAESPVSPIKEAGPPSQYSRSPARDIVRPTLAAAPASKGVMGSYKGHPFTMPIVSPEVHAQAASLGDVNSFVGSVHGRSGLDESDQQSFRASLRNVGVPFSGTPRSMSERLLMDDIMEAEEAKRRGS